MLLAFLAARSALADAGFLPPTAPPGSPPPFDVGAIGGFRVHFRRLCSYGPRSYGPVSSRQPHGYGLYRYGLVHFRRLYSYGLNSYGLVPFRRHHDECVTLRARVAGGAHGAEEVLLPFWRHGPCGHGICSYGPCSHGLYSYGLGCYGLCSYGLVAAYIVMA